MSTFLGSLREEHTLVGNDADRMSIEMAETCEQSRTVALLELMESAPVEHSGEDSLHVDVALVVDRDDTVELMGWEERLFCNDSVVRVLFVVRLRGEVRDDRTSKLDRMGL
jgi:hypothetical protein